MREVQAAGAAIAVREWGPEEGRPVLFWHALGPAASGETVREATPGLAARGFRVLAVDGPGFGRSPALPADRYELDSILLLVDDLIERLRLERFAFMGHSWGGSIAVHYAARRPERVSALVLLDSGHVDYSQLPDVDVERPLRDWVAEARTRTWRWPSERAFADELAPVVQRWSSDLLEGYLAGLRREGGELVGATPEARGAAFHGLAPACQSETWPQIRDAGIPTLLMLATLSPHVEVNERFVSAFVQALPDADVRWVENAGHGILADAGPKLGDEIAEWLTAQRSA